MKKNLKVLALVLASTGMLLTSCGDDTIYPSLDFKDDKITVSEQSSFTKEDLEKLYEKLHDSSTHGQEVRDIIIDRIAESTVGSFKIIGSDVKLVGYDIKSETDSTAPTADEKLTFVKEHNAYWNKEEVEGKWKPKKPEAIDAKIENRVQVIKDIVKREIVTKLFDEANSDLYKEHHVFKEIKYAREKFKTSEISAKVNGNSFSYVTDPSKKTVNIYDKIYEAKDDPTFHNNTLIDSSISKENPDSITTSMLHLDYYEDYINREILPSIVDTLLVEQYVYDNQYISLSRTQARKINYISIQANDTNNLKAEYLINAFVDTIKTTDKQPIVPFDNLANAWKGLPGEGTELLSKTNGAFTKIDTHDKAINGQNSKWYDEENVAKIFGENDPQIEFYKETEFGQLMLDYAKINNDKNDAESNAKQKDFSNSGAYGVAKGLAYKTNDIKVKDYTTIAWGTKDNGFSSLPSNIKDSLFEYSVSTDVSVTPTVKEDFDYETDVKGNVVLYKGHYFLKTDKSEGIPSIEDLIVHYDTGSKTYYMVEILEALSQSKLSYTTSEGDATTYNDAQREKISREIGYEIASKDTYKNTAYNKYLEACDIQYHDQSIYDYMKETYPDLFEEEK